jgi:hypothetical protein
MIPSSARSKLARRMKSSFNGSLEAKIYDSLLLQGRMASWRIREMETIRSLQDVEFRVFSQWGEDGVIDWLIERAAIPASLHTFVEFGVEAYRQANTRFLLENRNWRGLVMDGNPTLVETLKEDPLYWQYDLAAKSAFITRENINTLLLEAGFSGDIGLLSIDVDGNDYWIWEAISAIQPVICVCEYNAVLGDLHAISVPYDAKFTRGSSHFSHLYFGASIAALRNLAAQKGYRFLGTTQAANDAFFIRNDYASYFDSINKIVAWPSQIRESRDIKGDLSYISGRHRLELIADMPVIKTDTGEICKLGDLGPIYSNDWAQQMGNTTQSNSF